MSLITGNEEKLFAKGVIGNVRKVQEDCHGYKLGTPNGDLFVVCDGMGGHAGGEMASKMAVESIIEYIDKEHYDSPRDALNNALQYANMQILGYADSHPEYKGMGTTACIVLIGEINVWIAHVGDSRIYLYLGKEQELHRLTKDHSFVQTLVDSGEITDKDAEIHPNKNRITKALGISPDLHPTFNYNDLPILVKNRDVFLICSDGLSGMIPDSTIKGVMREKMTLKEKGEELIRLAMEGETIHPGGQDNCTLELIEIDKSLVKKSYFTSYNPVSKKKEKKKCPSIDFDFFRKYWVSFLVGLATLVVVGFGIWLFKIIYNKHLSKQIGENIKEIVKKRDKLNSDYDVAKYKGDGETEDMVRINDSIDSLDKKLDSLNKLDSQYKKRQYLLKTK